MKKTPPSATAYKGSHMYDVYRSQIPQALHRRRKMGQRSWNVLVYCDFFKILCSCVLWLLQGPSFMHIQTSSKSYVLVYYYRIDQEYTGSGKLKANGIKKYFYFYFASLPGVRLLTVLPNLKSAKCWTDLSPCPPLSPSPGCSYRLVCTRSATAHWRCARRIMSRCHAGLCQVHQVPAGDKTAFGESFLLATGGSFFSCCLCQEHLCGAFIQRHSSSHYSIPFTLFHAPLHHSSFAKHFFIWQLKLSRIQFLTSLNC